LRCKAEYQHEICAGILPLIELLRHEHSAVQEAAASALKELAKYGESYCQDSCETVYGDELGAIRRAICAAIPCLIELLSDWSSKVQEMVVYLMGEFAKYCELHQCMSGC
jgi:HEAT repeat protein